MKATDVLRKAMQFTDRFMDQYLDDMRDAPCVQPTPRGGNHALWVAGHLAVVEAELRGMITGDSSPLSHWEKHFSYGTEPTGDAKDYPPYDEVVATYREQRDATRALLDGMSDADLDRKPAIVPEELQSMFNTIADVFVLIAMHQEFHQGQVADARRAAGRKPLFMSPETATT